MATMLPLLLLLAGLMPPPNPPSPPSAPGTAPPPTASSPPIRGRDPWVFRCIFEDRSRMVIIAPAKDAWIAFNPNTCAVQKIWLGGMEFRGKVWDFSQDNCKAADNAHVLLEQPSTIDHLADQPDEPAGGWRMEGARFDEPSRAWVFNTDHAAITSGPLDLSAWDNIFITFEERGRPRPLRVELSDDDGATWQAQAFESTTHGTSANDWQRNLKQIIVRSPKTRFRALQEHEADAKSIRGIKIFGDQPSWSLTKSEGEPAAVEFLRPRWKGYDLVNGAEGVSLNFDLQSTTGAVISVRQQLDLRVNADGSVELVNALAIAGLPDGHGLTGPGVKTIRANGTVELSTLLRKGTR